MRRPLDTVLAALRAQGRSPRPVAKGYIARCPVSSHGQGRGDVNPSLSITEASDGTVLVRCFTGCSATDIVAALSLSLRDLFPRADHQAHHRPPRRMVARFEPQTRRDHAEIEALAARYEQAGSAGKLAHLATSLGLQAGSLRALGVGWDGTRRAWTFPMRDGVGRLVGIRLRLWNGRKLTVSGTREGLFIPADLPSGPQLVVAEGPTDTAALLDMGVPAIGRPSCTGGADHVVQFVRRHRFDEVVIAADSDKPGHQGAARLSLALLPYRPVRIITPPTKDIRAWRVEQSATAAELTRLISDAPLQQLRLTVVGGGRSAS